MIIASQVSIFSGIYSYTRNHEIETNLHYVTISCFTLTFLIMEVLHQRFLRQEPVKFDAPQDTTTVMSE